MRPSVCDAEMPVNEYAADADTRHRFVVDALVGAQSLVSAASAVGVITPVK